MKQKFPYLAEVSSQALCSATMFAEAAYKNFFASVKGTIAGSQVGKPKFKSKKSHDFSYRECMNVGLNWNERKIKVPKLGEVKFRHSGNKTLGFLLSSHRNRGLEFAWNNLSVRSWICPSCGAEHIRDVNAAINLKENAIKQVEQGVSKLMSVEGVERLTRLVLVFSGTSNKAKLTLHLHPEIPIF